MKIMVVCFLLVILLCGCQRNLSSSSDTQGSSSVSQSQEERLQKPTLPYHYELLTTEQMQFYDYLTQLQLQEGQEDLLPQPMKWDASAREVWELFQANNITGQWIGYAPYPIFGETIDTVVGFGASKRFDNRGNDLQMEESFKAQVTPVIAKIQEKQNGYEKIKEIADYLCQTISYCEFTGLYGDRLPQTDLEKEIARYAENEYGALVNHSAICSGYATAFQYLAEQSDIYSIVVIGEVNNNVPHMWNMVWLEGKWYHVDVTWMDSASEMMKSGYFLVSDNEIENTHTINSISRIAGVQNQDLFSPPKSAEKGYLK